MMSIFYKKSCESGCLRDKMKGLPPDIDWKKHRKIGFCKACGRPTSMIVLNRYLICPQCKSRFDKLKHV